MFCFESEWRLFLGFSIFRQNLFCDVTLIAENMEIPAHKMVLASCSPYFYAMFSGSEFEESRQDRITVQGVDFHALQLLIEYVYTSYVDVTEENVQVEPQARTLLLFILFSVFFHALEDFCFEKKTSTNKLMGIDMNFRHF